MITNAVKAVIAALLSGSDGAGRHRSRAMSDMPLAGTRVLVAEDELLVAMLIEDILEDNGCHVIGPFGSLGDALAAADAATVDVAVLDVNLRGDKIYPVAERLASRGIPFLSADRIWPGRHSRRAPGLAGLC